MGAAIPTAIGVAISKEQGNVLCVMGDGGMSPYLGEIKLAVNEKLNILFVCMSDGRYGSVASFADDSVEVYRAVNSKNPSWIEAVIGLGCEAARIDNYEHLSDTIANWNDHQGPLYLELLFDPSEYAKCHPDRLRLHHHESIEENQYIHGHILHPFLHIVSINVQ